MQFILQKYAFIAWNEGIDGLVKDFIVVEKDPEFQENYFTRKLPFSTGNCNIGWKDLTEFDLTLELFRIMFVYKFSCENKLSCYLKLGQIEEAKKFREWIRQVYYFNCNIEEFEERFYGHSLIKNYC